MDMQDIPAKFDDAQSKTETAVIAGRCEVWYSGRAEAHLQAGDRLIIIKEDQTLLIHQPKGNNPVNYMKPGTRISITYDNGVLYLNARNLALKEFLDIKIEDVFFFESRKLEDGQSLQLTGTEKDMVDMLYSSPHLIENGFKPLSQEEHTNYGFIDLFGHDQEGKLTVVECKRYVADLSAVTQLRRYVEKIEASKGVENVRGILAAPKITPNALNMLQDWGYSFVNVIPPNYLEKYKKDQTTLDRFNSSQ